MPGQTALVDQHGRRVNSLRISLTDRCNFRCLYCMPPEGQRYIPGSNYLSRQDIVRFVRVAARMGVSHYRLTGGEPLLRKDIVDIIRDLRAVDGVAELALTTNASKLAPAAVELRDAGLDRINISLDSLDADRFSKVARYHNYEDVIAGIEASIDAGFPTKINVVVLEGMEADEILMFADMAVRRCIEVRFLEFMPLCGEGWSPDLVLKISEVRDIVASKYKLNELSRGDKPAQTFDIVGTDGQVGFIAPLSEPFCESCSRIRISADGKLRPCLFSNYEVDLSPLIKGEATDDELADGIRAAVWHKPAGSQFNDTPFVDAATALPRDVDAPLMRGIGG